MCANLPMYYADKSEVHVIFFPRGQGGGCKMSTLVMAFPVVEFSRQGYKIRKVFG